MNTCIVVITGFLLFCFSFVQEFSSAPADGITLLLETLRGVQLIQSSPPSGQGGQRIGTRRAALDELGCVECLAACGERCADAPRLLAQAQPGLLALAVCLTSSLNRSRVLALQVYKFPIYTHTPSLISPRGFYSLSTLSGIRGTRYSVISKWRENTSCDAYLAFQLRASTAIHLPILFFFLVGFSTVTKNYLSQNNCNEWKQ